MLEKLRSAGYGAHPCLFYPAARRMGVQADALLTDAETQAKVLRAVAHEYATGSVVRMTELWCEAAAFGVPCAFPADGFPQLGEPLCEDADELAELVPPPAENAVTEPLIEAVRLAAPGLGKPLIVGITGPYTLGAVLNGSENFMMNCMTEPEAVHVFLERATAFLSEYALAYKQAGADGVMIAEPSVSMVSPEMAGEFSCRYLSHVIAAVQDEGFSVLYHNCGAVDRHMEILARLPARGFHFGSEVDLARALTLIPEDRAVMGNVDPRLFLGSDAEAAGARAVALRVQLGEHENFFCSTGCDLAPTARDEAIEAFIRAANA